MILIIALAFIVIGYFVEQAVYEKKWDKNLSVKMQFMNRSVAVGETTCLKEIVTNEKNMPISVLEVKFSAPSEFVFGGISNASKSDRYYFRNLFSVNANQRISRTIDFKVKKRGYYTIKSIELLSKDYFMMRQYGTAIGSGAELLVYPEKIETAFFNPLYKNILGELLIRKRLETDPFMFRGIREYRPTDNMKLVNWKHSAQVGELLVNTYGTTADYQLCILLDGRIASMIDREFIEEKLISLASSLAKRFLTTGMPVALNSSMKYKRLEDEEPHEVDVDFGYGRVHMDEIDYQLALIDTSIETDTLEQNIEMVTKRYGSEKLYLVVSANHAVRVKTLLDEYKGFHMYAVIAYTRNIYDEVVGKEGQVSDSRISYWEVSA